MKLRILVALAALALAGTAQADKTASQLSNETVQAERPTIGTPASRTATLLADEEYRIGANDLLEIAVFQVKELDRSVRVNSRGLISLPLIGSVNAAGASATELERMIADKLKEGYLQEPQVSVFIKEYTSQRVTVEGQVEKAGIYPITGRTTLLQAIALAGGMKELGESSIRVFRLTSAGMRDMIVVDLDQVRGGTIQDPTVKNNDIVVVEKNGSKAFIKSLTDTLRGFITFGAL